ncbi:hypothetical protein [Dactylosporangium sp. NPDC051541]|uniref:hypothetical protein n=1 Tax=Dactylosporangium sp. NPDC051541 TaxID=3363977 RepID=UPI003789A17C
MPVGEVPADVGQAALARGFGPLVSLRQLANARNRFILWLVISIACLGLLIATSALGSRLSIFSGWYSIVRFIGLFFCFGMVGALVTAIRQLVVGNRSYFVFSEGFIYRHNGKVQAYSWPETTGLQSVLGTRGEGAGKLSHYNLLLQGNAPVMIPIDIVDGRDEFLDHLIAALSRHGRPIT